MTRSYSELIRIPTYQGRFEYLRLSGGIGEMTFGGSRYVNQQFYHSDEWREFRRKIILRDEGCDLGYGERPIYGKILIHHLNPITIEDILQKRFCIIDPDNVVCVSFDTHNLIHYGAENARIEPELVTRTPYDTCPWRAIV